MSYGLSSCPLLSCFTPQNSQNCPKIAHTELVAHYHLDSANESLVHLKVLQNKGLSTTQTIAALRLGWDVCAEGFFCHVVGGCGVGPCSAAAAELFVGASAAFAFELIFIS